MPPTKVNLLGMGNETTIAHSMLRPYSEYNQYIRELELPVPIEADPSRELDNIWRSRMLTHQSLSV